MNDKKNIALVCGGFSKEDVISIKSASNIEQHISSVNYNTYKIVIQPERWFYTDKDNNTYNIDKNDFSLNLSGEKIKFDLVFIIIHGDPGENGRLQGYLDMLHIPYTTCNACTSALTFNKAYCNAVLAHNGILVASSILLFKEETFSIGEILNKVGVPCFVKPNAGGSSIGISKVTDAKDLPKAIETAFKEDSEVLIETFVKGNEYSCGLMRIDGEIKVFPLTQLVPETEFFDYEAKYYGKSKEITPAPLEKTVSDNIGKISTKVYQLLHCAGVVRCDFIIEEKTGKIYFLEVNTTPGQSAQSIVPQQVQQMGWTLDDFYEKLIKQSICSQEL